MLISEVDLSNTAIIVVSDHGQWPVAKLIYVNNILEQAGFLKRSGGQILLNETIAWYNGYNQVFINLKDREQGGIVDPSQYDSVVNQVMAVLSSVRDPDTGEPVFSVVMKKSEAKALGLFGDRVGDIIISTKPGYAPYGGFSPTGNPFVNATPLSTITANHQDLPYYPELWAVFGAVGAGIGHGVLGLIQSTSIAPTVTALLGIDPPLNSIGTPLPILKPITITHTQVSVVTATERVEITLERATTQTLTTTQTTTQTTTTTLQATTTLTTTQPVTTTVYETTSLALTSLAALILAIAILVLIFRKK
jgi:predicted AlkP superfamily pyrophosphatase or phosphodiesterase